MKWFKHISDSLDDPFIYDLISEHDAEGYLVFFGILEIYAREYHPEPEWKLDISWDYLRGKLHRTRNKQIRNILGSLQVSGKWEIVLDDKRVSIHIPKFKELLDDWTIRKVNKLDRNSVVTTKKLRKQTDTDKDKDNTLTLFEVFWSAYPKKKNKGQAEKSWVKINPSQELFEYIMAKLSLLKKSMDWLKDGGQFIPHPSTWLNAKGWDDEIDVQKKQDEADFL